MTKETQRMIIAEADGWERVENYCFKNESFIGSEAYGDGWRNRKTGRVVDDIYDLPNYLNSLNAIRAAVLRLPSEKRSEFVQQLYRICNADVTVEEAETHDYLAAVVLADAEQWSEAFIKTLRLGTPKEYRDYICIF